MVNGTAHALAFELTAEAYKAGGLDSTSAGLALGSLTFFAGDRVLDGMGGANRKRSSGPGPGGAAAGIVLGSTATMALHRAPCPVLIARDGGTDCAFPAAILGGLDSTGGAVVGGLVVGLAESFAAGYQDQIAFMGRGFGEIVPYIVMVLVLLVRPSGLFGTRELTRV